MPSTPAKVEDCPSRCRHPSSAFLRKAFTSWQRAETRQLETSNRSPAFLPNVLSNRQKWRYRTTTDKKKTTPKKYKTRETCQLQSSSRAVLHISKCTVKTISISMPKINLQTQHRHPQNTFIAILLQFWLLSSDIFCKSFQLLIFASFVPYGIKFLREEI